MRSRDIIKAGKRLKPLSIISESADPRLVKELRMGGLPVHTVRKGAGSVEAGLDFMKGLRMCVTSRSVNAQKELRNYTYQQLPDGRWLNIPVDDYNHIIDAARYVCMEKLMGRDRRKKAGTVTPGIFR